MIYVDISFELKNKTGIGAYILTLIKALDVAGLNYKNLELKLPAKTKFKFVFLQLWLNTYLLFCAHKKQIDTIIFPNFSMPYFLRKQTKYIPVIHDLCAYRLNEMRPYSVKIFQMATLNSIKKATTIITVSETVKKEIIEKFNVEPNRVKVVYNSVGEHFINSVIKDDILEKYNIQKNKYLLSVATLNKRKNISELIKAFVSISAKYPDLKLVLVGGMGNEQREKLAKHENIIFTGYIPDEELPTLYKNAMFYVFPSVYEGFGIPLIEAQYSNCPVLCSDIPVFNEVAQNSAEFSATNAAGIAEKIEYLINNPARREEMIELGKENVKRFAIEKIAEQLKEVLGE